MSRRCLAGVRTRPPWQPSPRPPWQPSLRTVVRGGLLVTVMVGLVLLLAGSPTDLATDRDALAAPPPPWTTADAAYVQAMLWHQEQGREMAGLVDGRTTRRELRRLARSMLSSGSSDAGQLVAWLHAHGVAEPLEDTGHRPVEQARRWFAGMMAEPQLQSLASTRGQRFDFLFVDMLLEHHKGAVVMADEVRLYGLDPQVRLLAGRAATSSKRSIRTLTRWRRRWAEPFIRQLASSGAGPAPASR